MPTSPDVLHRPMRAVLLAAGCLAFAACGSPESGEGTAAPVAEESAEVEQAAEPSPVRTPDPPAPDLAIFADGDDMAHTMCELWTATLDNAGELREVVDDVAWYAGQVDNKFMQSAVAGPWGAEDPGGTTVLCRWNGYEVQDGSPADLLG